MPISPSLSIRTQSTRNHLDQQLPGQPPPAIDHGNAAFRRLQGPSNARSEVVNSSYHLRHRERLLKHYVVRDAVDRPLGRAVPADVNDSHFRSGGKSVRSAAPKTLKGAAALCPLQLPEPARATVHAQRGGL